MIRMIQLASIITLIIVCMTTQASVIKVLDNVSAVDDNHPQSQSIPKIDAASITLKVTAYNDDPNYRRTVHFDIDGIGAQIAYGLAPTITSGYIPPKSHRTWLISLNKTYDMVVRSYGSYGPVENSGEERDVNYRDILASPGSHTINCYVAALERYAPKSTVSVELITSTLRTNVKEPKIAEITVDDADDPRVALAVRMLSEIAGKSPYNTYNYLIGDKSAGPFISTDSIKGLSDDGFIIRPIVTSDGATIAVRGATTQGTAYGVIRLVRTLKTYPGVLSKLNMRMEPAFPIRTMYEERPWCKQDEALRYKAQLEKYFEETINIADMWGVPLPPDPYYIADNYVYEQPYGVPKTLMESIDYAHSLGIKAFIVDLCQMVSFLDVPRGKIRNVDPAHYTDLLAQTENGGHDPTMLCLSNKTSLDIAKRQLLLKCRTIRNMDGLTAYFADPGGCWCKNCRPWGKSIIRALNDIYAPVIKETNPRLKVILSLWGVGIDDVRYIIDHLDELPSCVTALQIPPTSMVPNKYMTFETRIVPLIRKASRKYPIILQQFYDGVGFRDAWVDIWEHPMPESIASNLHQCDSPHGVIKGAYGSSFRLDDQLVDLRLMMELAWQPQKEPRQILTEYGNESFGPGVGKFFADAMYAMEDYWSTEARRFHFGASSLSVDDIAEIRRSLNNAMVAETFLKEAEPFVQSNKLYYKSFLELAELMRTSTEANIHDDAAWKSFEHGDIECAKNEISKAIALSDRIIDIISGSDRYSWLMQHPWWKVWTIGSRPSILRDSLSIFDSGASWGDISIQDPSFEDGKWEYVGDSDIAFTIDKTSGGKCAHLCVKNSGGYALISSQPIEVAPNCRYRISFRTKVMGGNPSLYLDWSSYTGANAIDGQNHYADIQDKGDWRTYTMVVETPSMEGCAPLSLRLVAVGIQDILIDDVAVQGPILKRQ